MKILSRGHPYYQGDHDNNRSASFKHKSAQTYQSLEPLKNMWCDHIVILQSVLIESYQNLHCKQNKLAWVFAMQSQMVI